MIEEGKPDAAIAEQRKPGFGILDGCEPGIGVVQLLTGMRGTKTEAVGCPGGLAAGAVWVLSPLGRGSDGLYVHLLFGLGSGLGLRSSELQADACIE